MSQPVMPDAPLVAAKDGSPGFAIVHAWADLRRQGLGYLAAIAAVALVSVVIGAVLGRVRITNISMLYLFAVLATAIGFGRGPAVVASVAAFLTFDWFFVEPYHTFTVADPEEWISLLFFLLVAILTGQLAADQRRRAQEAAQREREAIVLYDVVRLMNQPELEEALTTAVERLREELKLTGVAVDLARETGKSLRIVRGDEEAIGILKRDDPRPAYVLHQGQSLAPGQRGVVGQWVRVLRPHPAGRDGAGPRAPDRLDAVPVRAGDRRVGTLYVVRSAPAGQFDAAADRLLSGIAGQIGLVIERVRLRRWATEAEVLCRTDELR